MAAAQPTHASAREEFGLEGGPRVLVGTQYSRPNLGILLRECNVHDKMYSLQIRKSEKEKAMIFFSAQSSYDELSQQPQKRKSSAEIYQQFQPEAKVQPFRRYFLHHHPHPCSNCIYYGENVDPSHKSDGFLLNFFRLNKKDFPAAARYRNRSSQFTNIL
jgi:hypothetical protein